LDPRTINVVKVRNILYWVLNSKTIPHGNILFIRNQQEFSIKIKIYNDKLSNNNP